VLENKSGVFFVYKLCFLRAILGAISYIPNFGTFLFILKIYWNILSDGYVLTLKEFY
jgi:hypothetical protein